MLVTSNIEQKIGPQRRAVLEIKLGEQTKRQSKNGTGETTGVLRYKSWALAAPERSMLLPLQPIFGGEVVRSSMSHDWRLAMKPDDSINLALTADSCAILNRRVDPKSGTMIGDCDGDTISYAGQLSHRGPCLCKAENRTQCQISVTLEGKLYLDGVQLHPLVRSHNRSENLARELAPAAELFERAAPGDVVLANVGFVDNQGTGRQRYSVASKTLEIAAFARIRINGMVLVPAALLDRAAADGTIGELYVTDYELLRERADALTTNNGATPLQMVAPPAASLDDAEDGVWQEEDAETVFVEEEEADNPYGIAML